MGVPRHIQKGGGGLRHGHNPKKGGGVLGTGTTQRRGVLGTGTTQKRGVLGTGTSRKRGVLGMGTSRKRTGGYSYTCNMYCGIQLYMSYVLWDTVILVVCIVGIQLCM